jgi:hypothetical protein
MGRKTRKIKQKGGAEIKVDLEHSYYSPFTPECLKGSSGEQIRDINKNFIFEYDDDTLKEMMEPTPAREKLMGLLDRLSPLPFDFKLIISESSKCIPTHWETEEAAPAYRPRIIIFIACKSEGVLMRNNFGPPPKSGRYKFTAGDTQPRKGGVFKNIYYFGFSDLVHLHNGDIYACKKPYMGAYPKLSCDLPRIQGDARADCCGAKKNHFTSMFIEAFKTRDCFKLTEDDLLEKFGELLTVIGEETIRNGLQPSLDTYNSMVANINLFKITKGLSCEGANPCAIVNQYKGANEKSERFNKLILPDVPKGDLKNRDKWFRAIMRTQNPRNPDTKNASGSTLIEYVISAGSLLQFKALLEKGAKLNDMLTVLLLTSSRDKEFVKVLYTVNPQLINKEYKVPPDFIPENFNENSLTPLSIVSLKGDPELLEFLLNKGGKITQDDIDTVSASPEMLERLQAVKLQANSHVAAPPSSAPLSSVRQISESRQKELNRRRTARHLGWVKSKTFTRNKNKNNNNY